VENSTPPEARLSRVGSEAGYQAGYIKLAFKLAFKQALKQALMRQRAVKWTRSDSVTGITAKTPGSNDWYRSISGRQPYIGP